MSGKFVISCTDKYGVNHKSKSFALIETGDTIRKEVMYSMPFLNGKVSFYETMFGDVSNAWQDYYVENGKSIIAIFSGFNENPPLCKLESDATTPIEGKNVRYVTNVLRPFG